MVLPWRPARAPQRGVLACRRTGTQRRGPRPDGTREAVLHLSRVCVCCVPEPQLGTVPRVVQYTRGGYGRARDAEVPRIPRVHTCARQTWLARLNAERLGH